MTAQEVIEILKETRGIIIENGYCTEVKDVDGRHYRVFDQYLQISDTDFDKWGNSVESTIRFSRMKRKRFMREMNMNIGSPNKGVDSKTHNTKVDEETKREFLRLHNYYKDLVEEDGNLHAIHRDGSHQKFTPREIYQSLHWRDRRSYKKNVKHYNNRKNRSATRQHLAHENYDIFNERHEVKRDDIWAWD